MLHRGRDRGDLTIEMRPGVPPSAVSIGWGTSWVETSPALGSRRPGRRFQDRNQARPE